MQWRWIFFHSVNTKLISDRRNSIFPFHVHLCKFWMQGVNEKRCGNVFTGSTRQNFSYLAFEEGVDWHRWCGWGSERQLTVNWSRINHISNCCGSIWIFGLCRDTLCIFTRLWWEKAAGGAEPLSQPSFQRALGQLQAAHWGVRWAILLVTPKMHGGCGGVTCEPFTIWTFAQWAVRLSQQSQRGCLLPFPSHVTGSHSVFSSSELNWCLGMICFNVSQRSAKWGRV